MAWHHAEDPRVPSLRDSGSDGLRVGQCRLVLDLRQSLVWGVDPYGLQMVVASSFESSELARALRWADDMNAVFDPAASVLA